MHFKSSSPRTIIKQNATDTVILNKSEDEEEVIPASSVNIESAFYGVHKGKHMDVKRKLEIGKKITNSMMGGDPCPGKRKVLIVVATVTKIFREGELLTF